MLRYRRNINCLTTDQLHDLREALAILYRLPPGSPNSYLTVGGIHGQPSPAWCIHGVPGFLTWHRAYLLEFERALHCLNPSVQPPYWDWSSGPTTGVPAACASPTYTNRDGDVAPNPLFAGPLPSGGPGVMTARRADIDTTSFADLATTAQAAMGSTDFTSFQNAINNVHGSVHGRVGGNMSSVPYAGFDPIFHLHHANVDRLWAVWQAAHPGALPPPEAAMTLEPFVKPCTDAPYRGSDMESTTALGYAYTAFCRYYLGPFTLKEIRVKLEPWIRTPLDAAKLVLRSSSMHADTFDVRVFVNTPDADLRTPTDGQSGYAGAFGIFGMGAPAGNMKGASASNMMAMRGERFDLELDITDALRAAQTRKRKTATLTLVPVNPGGKAPARRSLHFDGLELHVR